MTTDPIPGNVLSEVQQDVGDLDAGYLRNRLNLLIGGQHSRRRSEPRYLAEVNRLRDILTQRARDDLRDGAEAACTCPAYDGVGRMACDTCGHESTAHEAHDGPCSASSSSSDRFIEGIAEAVAKVTPCACSAQRARADRAEAALAEAWDAGWEMRETARLHGREGDDFNPWRGGS